MSLVNAEWYALPCQDQTYVERQDHGAKDARFFQQIKVNGVQVAHLAVLTFPKPYGSRSTNHVYRTCISRRV